MKKQLIFLTIAAVIIIPFSAYAGGPLDTVKGHVDKVINVLDDPSLKGETGKQARKVKIRFISEKMFDFNELSKRTLGQNWSRLNGEQQKEFMELYRSLLEDLYADRILSYKNEKIVFSKENALSEKTAEVQTTVVTKKADVPINYRVIQKQGEWRVYDVVIEGVSLINNYRTQFREILANKPPDALIDTLRKKVGKT